MVYLRDRWFIDHQLKGQQLVDPNNDNVEGFGLLIEPDDAIPTLAESFVSIVLHQGSVLGLILHNQKRSARSLVIDKSNPTVMTSNFLISEPRKYDIAPVLISS